MSSAEHASEAIFSRLYLADKTVYSRQFTVHERVVPDQRPLNGFVCVCYQKKLKGGRFCGTQCSLVA